MSSASNLYPAGDDQSTSHWHFPDSFTLTTTSTSFDNDAFFDDAFHCPSPAPPHPTYLDTILNPIENADFDYPFGAPVFDGDMSSSRHGRLSNGYVDLTNEPPDTTRPQRPKRESPAAGPSTKRQKRNDGTAVKHESQDATVDEIDLSDATQPVQHVLQKQREEAVQAQARPEEPPTTFNTFNCVICMDTPTDLTATVCGHLFCHTCLMEALIAGENRTNRGDQRRSQCPVCRKNISRSKASDIIPLLLKKGLATQPRKARHAVAAAAAAARSPKVQS